MSVAPLLTNNLDNPKQKTSNLLSPAPPPYSWSLLGKVDLLIFWSRLEPCCRIYCSACGSGSGSVTVRSGQSVTAARLWWLSRSGLSAVQSYFSLRPHRPYRLLGTGSPGWWPPRLSHSSWTLGVPSSNPVLPLYLHTDRRDYQGHGAQPDGHLTTSTQFKFRVALRDVHRRRSELQALVYDILPSTAAVFSYATGSRKSLANEQIFVGAQTVVRLLQTTQIKQGVSFIAANYLGGGGGGGGSQRFLWSHVQCLNFCQSSFVELDLSPSIYDETAAAVTEACRQSWPPLTPSSSAP